jgi:uncharacterized protein (TIGR00290 family)
MAERVLLTWSGGKDCAMALHELESVHGHEIVALLTTLTEDYDRVSMHGVRRVLVEKQAECLHLPLEQVRISKDASNEEYEARMKDRLLLYQGMGVSSVVFGDIFIEDVRRYREQNLARIGMKAVFPLWKRSTTEVARAFVGLGFKAVITCVDTSALDGSFAGRVFDERLLSGLPADIDPCGENGEFHTFVFDGPIFRRRIPYRRGKVVLRDGRFRYCDLLPL